MKLKVWVVNVGVYGWCVDGETHEMTDDEFDLLEPVGVFWTKRAAARALKNVKNVCTEAYARFSIETEPEKVDSGIKNGCKYCKYTQWITCVADESDPKYNFRGYMQLTMEQKVVGKMEEFKIES